MLLKQLKHGRMHCANNVARNGDGGGLIVRASWSALIVSFLIGALLVIGFFIFHPVYISVCEGGQHGAAQKCEPRDILHVAFFKIWEIMAHAEFWTAVAT